MTMFLAWHLVSCVTSHVAVNAEQGLIRHDYIGGTIENLYAK